MTYVQVHPLPAVSLQQFLAVKKKSKVFSGTVKVVDILDQGNVMDSNCETVSGVVTNNKRLDLLELLSIKSEAFDKLVARFSDLPRLIRTVAYLLRCALSRRYIGGTSAGGRAQAICLGMTEDEIKKFVKEQVPEVSASEYNDAWLVIIALEQSLRLKEKDVKKLVPAKISVKLATYNWTVEHVVLGGRVSSFPVGFGS